MLCCRSLDEITKLVFFYIKCPLSIQEALQAFQRFPFFFYPQYFLMYRNFYVSTL